MTDNETPQDQDQPAEAPAVLVDYFDDLTEAEEERLLAPSSRVHLVRYEADPAPPDGATD